MGIDGVFSPVDIRITQKQELMRQLEDICGQGTSIFIISTNAIKRYDLDRWFLNLQDQYHIIHIDYHTPNPSIDDVADALSYIGDRKFNRIIAWGGGSCIDLGKAISALHFISESQGDTKIIRQCITDHTYRQNGDFRDVIAIPTTAGTASEVTKWATIWDLEYERKLSVEDERCFPKMAYIVPELTITMNDRITLSTGLDTLCHAMEGFWARSSDPLAKSIALKAIEMVRDNLQACIQDGSDMKAREGMCVSSVLAGLAFSRTRTTACHSMSYPLTMFYGIEHGFACAISLMQIALLNCDADLEISKIFGLWGGYEAMEAWMREITDGIQPLRLSAWHVPEKDIDRIAEHAFTKGRMDNNPYPLSKDEVVEVLRKIY